MIKVDNISKSFEGSEVLKGISTIFEKGKTNLIIGQSGSGKTVFLKCLLGLFETNSGQIFFERTPIDEMNFKMNFSMAQERSFGFLYRNHFDQAREQLSRHPRPLPEMQINSTAASVSEFAFEDFTLIGYDPHPHIKAPVAV